jgi:putative hemolysin
MREWIGFLGRMVMVAVAAILVAGCLAAPAAARTRDDGVQEANEFVAWCFSMGGEAEVLEAGDSGLRVRCQLPDGNDFHCNWVDIDDWQQSCGIASHPIPGGNLPTLEPGDLHGVEPVQGEPAPAAPPDVTAPGDNQDDEQVNEPKKKKKKQANKARKAKGKGKAKHGKPKPRGRAGR